MADADGALLFDVVSLSSLPLLPPIPLPLRAEVQFHCIICMSGASQRGCRMTGGPADPSEPLSPFITPLSILDGVLRGDGGVPGHGLGRQVVVAVGAVQEGLPPLAVAREVGVEDQPRAGGGLGVQGAAAGRRAILHIEAGRKQREKTQRW
ncbi:hypothetical protein EYF80_040832 [Liparis tanakae]|uniref:Uncharacterized protein n=1 Tax=Liparis tanakae TaxID=230148 RepID=A0A4Z2G8R9_9TELE|nr:hypothetical protein EYF80_040832 [Liparis tanakae]